jgi:hypothetical protein
MYSEDPCKTDEIDIHRGFEKEVLADKVHEDE